MFRRVVAHLNLLLLICLMGGIGLLSVCANEVNEYAVKGAYLFKLGNYVRWPEKSTPKKFVLAIWGENPSNEVLQQFASAKIGSAPIVSSRVATLAEAGACQMLFVPGETEVGQAKLREAVAKYRGQQVLIIAECPGAIEAGASIYLVRVEDTIKFELNVAAAEKAGLTFDARVQRIAHAVHRGAAGDRP